MIIFQAADTDISALVEIEQNSPHPFEFFMDLVGDQSVSARTAQAYMKSGGRVSHALSVYSCQLHKPIQVPSHFLYICKLSNTVMEVVLIQMIVR